MIGADVFLEEAQRRIALAFADVAQHLIVAAILFDDVDHVLDGGGNARRNRVELFVGVGRVGFHLGGVLRERFVGQRGNERCRAGLDVRDILNVQLVLSFALDWARSDWDNCATLCRSTPPGGRRPAHCAAVGYQPVGTKPSTWLRASVTSTTAAALASEQTTYRRL